MEFRASPRMSLSPPPLEDHIASALMNVGVGPSNVWHSVHVQHVCTYIMCNVILITNMIVYMVVFGDKPILVVDNTPHCLLNKASHCALITLSCRYHMLHLFLPIWSVHSPLPGLQL